MTTNDLEKEIFDTVYQWGRLGVIADLRAPTYQQLIKDLLHSHNQDLAKQVEGMKRDDNVPIISSVYKEISVYNEALDKIINLLTND